MAVVKSPSDKTTPLCFLFFFFLWYRVMVVILSQNRLKTPILILNLLLMPCAVCTIPKSVYCYQYAFKSGKDQEFNIVQSASSKYKCSTQDVVWNVTSSTEMLRF